MKPLSLLVVAFIQVSCIDTRQLFTVKEEYPAYEIKATHKKVAILPVNYVDNSDSKDLVGEMIDSKTDPLIRQEERANKFQHIIYEELYRLNKKTDWQTDKATNRILKEKNISFQDISRLSKTEIANKLDVDAVVYFDFAFKIETVNKEDKKKALLTNGNDVKNVVEVTVEIYSTIANDLVWRGTSMVDRQKIYSPTLFKDLIGRQLEPVLPFN
ncbi:hypothetical protein [Emticicia sp. C21]|uniref:hypothetical protein n=1 Tax=Emticicia sp. C21 TaxID=2302915 RepID=UPI000E34134D|nr:hypothetical protein [Emticicia sp. C21]RFS16917.1 hypothetical protein D0T08_09575 [Emticicia sp. C21]